MRESKKYDQQFAQKVVSTNAALRLQKSQHVNSPTRLGPYNPSMDFLQLSTIDQNPILAGQEISKFIRSGDVKAMELKQQNETQLQRFQKETAITTISTTPQAKRLSIVGVVQQYAKQNMVVEQARPIPLNFTKQSVERTKGIVEQQKSLAPNLRDANINVKIQRGDKSWELEEQVRQMAIAKQKAMSDLNKKKVRVPSEAERSKLKAVKAKLEAVQKSQQPRSEALSSLLKDIKTL